MKMELGILGLVGATLLYNTYIKPNLSTLYTYGQLAALVGFLCYLIYLYLYKPTDYYNVVEMTQKYLLDNSFNVPMHVLKKETRNVTGLMKKKVAANQQWKCGHCKSILDASYEVDHILALYKGGTNSESNLIALCRNCHGKKTVEERL